MSIPIQGYQFEGPYQLEETWQLADRSGVYVILTDNRTNYTLLDVGKSATVKSRVENHDRAHCWRRNNQRGLYVAVLYCSQWEREQIEQKLRQRFSPVCGVR